MKEELLLEGGVPGHMNHIYDNGEMTFGELKQLLQAAVDGKLRGTEKTDGQNLSISFNTRSGRAIAARNKGQLKSGGLDPEELDSFFSEHPSQALRYSFVEALLAFENAVKDLDKDTLVDIFGQNNQVYYNVEVMNPGNPDAEEGDPRRKGTTNVIPYDKKTLLIHEVGHFYYDPKLTDDENAAVDVSSNYDRLEPALRGKATDDPTIFSVETHPQRKLAPEGLESMRKVLQPTIAAINNLMQDIQVNDSETINHYVSEQVAPQIEQFGLTEDVNRMIMQRVMKIGDYPGLPQITKGMPVELKQEVSQFVKDFKYAEYTLDLQRILHDFSSAALEGFESAFIGDNQKQIKFLQDKIKTEIDAISNSSNERAKAELKKQMIKLKSIKGVNTPSEGFVFDWNGTTYKFTGNFAPANQILGMRPFNRFGPIEPLEAGEEPLKAETGPLTVGVVAGAFKPPHVGHAAMLLSIATKCDKTYLVISNPTAVYEKGDKAGQKKSARFISMHTDVKDIEITSETSELMWRAMVDLRKYNIEIVMTEHASPIRFISDFISVDPLEMEENPDLVVAPENAAVKLGVSTKGGDDKRFEGIIKRAGSLRPDLDTVVAPVAPKEHSSKYNKVIDGVLEAAKEGLDTFDPQLIELVSNIPSVISKKSGITPDQFHGSDMRYMMGMATMNPFALDLLKDFVPANGDVMQIMGILGLNPVDREVVRPEEDQVEEPELYQIDTPEMGEEDLREIIAYMANIRINEGFNAQKAPKGRASSDPYQKNMRTRLSRAMTFYLDQGRHDLTKHGGGFHLPRPKNQSNAFLAEDEELDEMSSMAAGNVTGYAAPIGKKDDERGKKMNTEEKRLRRKIRIGLKEFFNKKASQHEEVIAEVLEEHRLRMQLRDIIFETSLNESEDPNTDVHDNTGINTLKDLLKNTNILATMRQAYKTLTTDEDQKRSFRAHIVKWIQDTLAPVKLNDTPRPAEEEAQLTEEVGVDIDGIDASMFIDAADGSEKETSDFEPEEEEEMAPIEGEDTTGRNKAERIYPSIEKSIVDYYAELDNPEDQEMYYDYLIANVKLYFDKWNNEMAKTVEEPTNAAYDAAAMAR